MVAGVDDIIQLYIANKLSTGQINAVDLGTPTDDDCTLLTLPVGSPMHPSSLSTRSITRWIPARLGLSSRGAITTRCRYCVGSYPCKLSGCRISRSCQFHGSSDFAEDVDGNTVTQLVPTTGNWLPDGKTFCAFAFTLTAMTV